MKVLKFGGAGLRDAEAFFRFLDILKENSSKTLIVVSAIFGVTDKLEKINSSLYHKNYEYALKITNEIRSIHNSLAKKILIEDDASFYINQVCDKISSIIKSVEILNGLNNRIEDMILSCGELLSSKLAYWFLQKNDLSVAYIDPRSILLTDANYKNAEVNVFSSQIAFNSNCTPLFEKAKFVITGGFIGANENGEFCTLGRGGSDYSAALFASFIKADVIELWKEVDGIMSADPKIVEGAMILNSLTYIEALEISNLGAKALHKKTIYPLMKSNIPLKVLNCLKSEQKGTIISNLDSGQNSIKNITIKNDIDLIKIEIDDNYKSSINIEEIINNCGLELIFISYSNTNIQIAIENNKKIDLLLKILNEFAKTQIIQNLSVISIVGSNINSNNRFLSEIFNFIKDKSIIVHCLDLSSLKMRLIIDTKQSLSIAKNIHNMISF